MKWHRNCFVNSTYRKDLVRNAHNEAATGKQPDGVGGCPQIMRVHLESRK
jgi:hypothetical protein